VRGEIAANPRPRKPENAWLLDPVAALGYHSGKMEKPAKTTPKPQRTAADIRADRLKAALKANMAKRKAQTKERAKQQAAKAE
jgi:hypothetical protein